MSRSRNWAFTLNNYTPADLARLADIPDWVSYVIFGKEVSPTTGTPHLQGFVQFAGRERLTKVKSFVGEAHCTVARRVVAAIAYCRKDGDVTEHGEFDGRSGQGNRADLEDFKVACREGISLEDIRESYSEVYAKFPRFCLEYYQDHLPKKVPPEHPLRPWQVSLRDRLVEPADARKVVFLVDELGNQGKTWFAHWFAHHHPDAQVLLPGKKADMSYALRSDISVLFVDAPRSKQGEYLQYDFLEDVKNGYVFSSKYESRVKTLGPVHVVVSMNEEPDRTKLSADRYDVIHLLAL